MPLTPTIPPNPASVADGSSSSASTLTVNGYVDGNGNISRQNGLAGATFVSEINTDNQLRQINMQLLNLVLTLANAVGQKPVDVFGIIPAMVNSGPYL